MKNINLEKDNWCTDSCKEVVQYVNNISKGYGGSSNYYGMQNGKTHHFDTQWPTYLTKSEFLELLAQQEFNPKEGEMIEVCDKDSVIWHKRKFLAKCNQGYIGEINDRVAYIYTKARPITPDVKIDITCTVNGKEKDPKDFTDEEWLALKK